MSDPAVRAPDTSGADTLRRAAALMLGDDDARWRPVGEWVDHVALALDTGDPDGNLGFGESSDARVVARAYLGES